MRIKFCGRNNPMRILLNNAFLIVAIFVLTPYVIAHFDPYETIGVRKDASLEQIKKAYRELAKRLHPDSSNLDEDEASRRFIELNKAFSILKDPQKRSRYDQFGDTDEGRNRRGGFGGHQHQNRQTREYWSNSNGYRTFTFYSTSESQLSKKSINSHRFQNEYARESKTKPFLIFFYSDFCPSCKMIEGTWIKIVDELAKYHIGSFTINVHHEPQLAYDLGVQSIPYLACMIDGKVKSYHPSDLSRLSLGSTVKFIKSILPSNLYQPLLYEKDQDRFIAFNPKQNKLSAILFSNDSNLKLRHLLIAYALKDYYRFGLISTNQASYTEFSRKYNITIGDQSKKSNLLVFDEDITKPKYNIPLKTDEFDMSKLRDILRSWPYTKLPRLTSQLVFDDLCIYPIPKDQMRFARRLCVILFTTEQPATQLHRENLIEFIEQNGLAQDSKVVFSYIDTNKQKDFVGSLLSEINPLASGETIETKIILLERHPSDYRKATYRWLNSNWNSDSPDELERAKIELIEMIQIYKSGQYLLKDKVALVNLQDEEGLSFLFRIGSRIVDYVQYITSRESFFTIVILLVCALITSIFLYQMPVSNLQEADSIIDSAGSARANRAQANYNDINIIELKAETYFGMILLLRPGYQSIILLTDQQSKDALLVKFKKAVWPYRRNKTLLFGYLCLDKNLDWYRSLWEEVLEVDFNNLNKKNCIGTVLALNGFKKYIRVYHAKHHEIDRYNDETDNDGAFLGFDEDDTEASSVATSGTIYTVDNLLDRLPIWLDKTFDGITKKYYLTEWPNDIK